MPSTSSKAITVVFAVLLITTITEADEISPSEKFHFNEESRLRYDLFEKQKVNNQSRPVQYLNETLMVNFDLFVIHVAGLDEATETLTLNCWVINSWFDLHFKWDPKDYDGIDYLPVPKSKIWTPDIYLLNSASARSLNPIGDSPPLVSYYGMVYWFPPATYKSICPLDLRAFPFDEHICRLMFVSWSHWEGELNISMSSVNQSLTMYKINEHNEWEIVSSHGNRSEFTYPGYPDYPIYFTSYYVHLRRRAPYYGLALLIPCIITILATLALFWIPPTVGEKFYVGGMNVLSLAILLIHLYWVVPRSGSNIPGIVFLCGNSMFFAGLSMVLSTITTSLCRRNPSIALPNIICSLLSNSVVNTALCLQSGIKAASISGTAQLLINEEEEEEEEEAEQPESSSPSPADQWIKLAVAIDRLFFLIYCIAFIAILIAAFG